MLIAENELNQPSDVDESMTIEDHILLNSLLEIERNETLFQGTLDEIYLTYLAMITMQSSDVVTMSHFNSMQKRDIIEKIDISYDSVGKVTLRTFDEFSDKPQELMNFSKTKLQMIGRPKAYRIEELSNTEGDHKDESKSFNTTDKFKQSKTII